WRPGADAQRAEERTCAFGAPVACVCGGTTPDADCNVGRGAAVRLNTQAWHEVKGRTPSRRALLAPYNAPLEAGALDAGPPGRHNGGRRSFEVENPMRCRLHLFAWPLAGRLCAVLLALAAVTALASEAPVVALQSKAGR